MFEFFKRKPKEETPMIRVDTHKEIIAEYAADIEAAQESARLSDATLQEAIRELRQERETVARISNRNLKLIARLSQIIALETPNCAHIGKRMARIARGEDAQAREKGEAVNG